MKTDDPSGSPTDAPTGGGDLARIAAELRALGEPELDDSVEASAIASLVATPAVLTAFALAYPPTSVSGPIGVAELAPLSELDRHRVWRRIASRQNKHAHPAAPSWRATWVAVATAAGLLLVPMLSPRGELHETTPASRATAQALAVEARSALERLPGEQDGARASTLAAQYAARLDGPEAAR